MVSETKADIRTAAATTTPNSRKRLPVNPCKKITGRNTTASVMEVEMTAKKISLLPSKAALLMDNPSSILRKIFSVTTMPSSTTKPVAKTIASKVSTLIEKPARYIIKKVAISDMGISISGRMAINQFLKKKKITSTTNEKEMIKVSFTSFSDCLTFLVLSMSTRYCISDLLAF